VLLSRQTVYGAQVAFAGVVVSSIYFQRLRFRVKVWGVAVRVRLRGAVVSRICV